MAIPVLSFITVSNNSSTVPSTCRFQNSLYSALRKNEPCFCSWRRGEGEDIGRKYLWRYLTVFFLIIWESNISNLTEFVIAALGAILLAKLLRSQPSGCSWGNRHWLPWERGCVAVPGQHQQDQCETNVHSTNLLHTFPNLTSLQSLSLLPTLLLPRAYSCFLGNHRIKMGSGIKGEKFPISLGWESMF